MESTPAETESEPWSRVVKTYFCGLCMGTADIVPGVSGGTVALILGVYQRLLSAISSFDAHFLSLLKRMQWTQAARHVDFHFLVALALGILTGVIGLAGLMDYLLTHHRSITFASFFGLILASGLLVGRMTQPKSKGQLAACMVLGFVAALGALAIMSLGRVIPLPGYAYTFFCGMIAICAMILPGISGAYLLLMLGKYEEITHILKGLPRFETTFEDLLTVAVFSAGCLLGLLLFSRVLRWFLRRYWSETMAVLCGFMLGSLYRIWPLQIDTTPEVEKFKQKIFQPVWPDTWTSEVAWCLVAAVISLAAVLLIDALGSRISSKSSNEIQAPSTS